MIIDALSLFSDAQALTATADSTNVVDLGAAPTTRNLGVGDPVYLVVHVPTALASSGNAATLTIRLASDSTANLDTSQTDHIVSEAIAEADLVAGYSRVWALPHGNYERYLGIEYTVGTENFTSGAISAFLTRDPQAWAAYPNAI
jgi:hypothetical protein